MLENWCWQPEILARLSKHHESGEALSAELMETMIKAKNVHESVFMMRQIYLVRSPTSSCSSNCSTVRGACCC